MKKVMTIVILTTLLMGDVGCRSMTRSCFKSITNISSVTVVSKG